MRKLQANSSDLLVQMQKRLDETIKQYEREIEMLRLECENQIKELKARQADEL